jgi:hypothetical protein
MDVICFLYISLGSSTIQFMIIWKVDMQACVLCLVSIVKMSTVLEGYTTEKLRPLVRLYGQKDSMQKIFIKKCFLFMLGRVCRVNRFRTGSINSLKDVQKSQMMPDQVPKWLRQQSKYFYAAGFDALVKRWDKCINVGGGYVISRFEYHILYIYPDCPSYFFLLRYEPVGISQT